MANINDDECKTGPIPQIRTDTSSSDIGNDHHLNGNLVENIPKKLSRSLKRKSGEDIEMINIV